MDWRSGGLYVCEAVCQRDACVVFVSPKLLGLMGMNVAFKLLERFISLTT